MKNHVFVPNFKKDYPLFVKGEGNYFFDSNGKKYLDATAGPFISSVGHGRTDVAEILKQQASTLEFAYRTYSLCQPVLSVADRLHKITGHEKFMLVSGGTEANEAAVRITRQYFLEQNKPEKYKILGRHLSYHGCSMYTISVAEHIGFRSNYQPYTKEQGHIPPAYCYRCWYGKTPATCNLECAKALESEIIKQDPNTVAGLLLETISGSSLACAMPLKTGYYEIIQEICRKYDVLLILDEILVGAGRTGKFNAFEHYNITPDILTMAKGIGGGYLPVAFASCSKKVADVLENGSGSLSIGHTMTNQPMQAAVLLKILDIIESENLLENTNKMHDVFQTQLNTIMKNHPTVGDVRGMGLLWGIEFVADKASKALLPEEYKFSDLVVQKAQDLGLLLLSYGQTSNDKYLDKPFMKELFAKRDILDGKVGDKIMITPPLTINKQEAIMLFKILDQAIAAVEKRFNY